MQTRPVHSEVMQTRQLALPRPRRARITSALSRLSDLPPSTLTTPPVSLPPIFSTLPRVDPNSEEFLPILGLFIQNKGEHKLLARLKGSAAVYVADILDKVSNHRAVGSHETWADFRVAFGCASYFPPPKTF